MFNLETAAEVAAYFLSKHGGSMDKVKLNKLMYLAERECILSYGTPLTDDLMFSHDLGPILENSDTFFRNGPKNTYEQEVWSKWFKTLDKASIEISLNTKDFGEAFQDKFNNLFRAARKIMDQIYSEYGDKSHKDIVSLVHSSKVCPEWRRPVNHGEHEITIENLCSFHGKTSKETKEIIDSIKVNREMSQAMEELANYGRI